MTTHTVPAESFDLLASGDGDTLGALGAGQRSKRLLLLRELISMTSACSPSVFAAARAAEAFAVLADAQRCSPHAVDEVLLQPHVGAWATRCLRSLVSEGEIPPEDIGHLGAVAASAALRAGQAFEVTAYLRHGSVMFPTFGLARLGRRRGWCRLRSRPGASGVELSAEGTTTAVPFTPSAETKPLWLPLRRLNSSAGGVEVDVDLDDLDPFRGCGHLPTMDRLDAAAVEDWRTRMDEAWSVLVDGHRAQAEAIAAGVVSIVPLHATEAAADLSGSCHEAVGAVAMTPPQNALSLAIALVHEFQHTKLSALLDLVPLLARSPGALFYAPWRRDPRPLRGLLQGAYAYLGLTVFWEVQRARRGTGHMPSAELAHFEFAMGRHQVGQAVDLLLGSGQLRRPGVRFVEGMRRRIAELNLLPVPAGARSSARLAYLDHATSWRLRNLRPDPEQVAEWTDAWLSGRACPRSSRHHTTVIDGSGQMPSDVRLDLLRQRLGAPGGSRLDADRGSRADGLLLSGRLEQAAHTYRAQIADAPDDLASWAGLALVRRDCLTSATWALTTCPESVLAVHRGIASRCGTPPDVEALASWISRSDRKRRSRR